MRSPTEPAPEAAGNLEVSGYRITHCTLGAFDLTGYTAIVRSGGDLYAAARQDGRWEALRRVGGADGTIYGVASLDEACPKGRYRYTLAVRAPAERFRALGLVGELYSVQIAASGWLSFSLDSFSAQYGALWRDAPYKLIVQAGWTFNDALGLHLDAYGPSYLSDDDAMTFMMPVKPRDAG